MNGVPQTYSNHQLSRPTSLDESSLKSNSTAEDSAVGSPRAHSATTSPRSTPTKRPVVAIPYVEPSLSTSPPLPIPEISYASSDDEDCFFDAEDQAQHNSIESPASTRIMTLKNNSSVISDGESLNSEGCGGGGGDSSSIDYDQMYESDEEENFDLVGSHGSVISHLISQVKIGMDLTKVALPTFILETRSLLEMYADFFAHPDVFVR